MANENLATNFNLFHLGWWYLSNIISNQAKIVFETFILQLFTVPSNFIIILKYDI